MRRREFVAGFCGVAATWPLVARAQQPPARVVGYLASSRQVEPFVTAFRAGLRQFGYVEGVNITIEYRSAEGHFERLPALAAELVQRHVAAIVAPDGTASALAAKAATGSRPQRRSLCSSIQPVPRPRARRRKLRSRRVGSG
jgi:putative tryptophan/tyrosine transport system substrate-binding protein